MKSLYMLAATILIAGAGIFGIALAHTTLDSGTASMAVHSTPSHTIVAGVPFMLYFNIKNTEPGFSVGGCDCSVIIGQEKNIFQTTQLVAADDGEFNTAPVMVIFPNDGVFDITVTGMPNTPGAFKAFTIDYDTYVLPLGSPIPDDEDYAQSDHMHTHGMSPLQHVAHLSILFGGIIAASVVVIRERKNLFKKK